MKINQRILWPLLILAVGLITAVFLIRTRPRVEPRPVSFPPPLVRTMEVELQDHPLTVLSQGTVSPRTESDLVAQVAGQIIEVAPDFAGGGSFSAGDILLRIDPRDYRFEAARREAEVAQTRLALVQEEEEAQIAREEWNRLNPNEEPPPLVIREPQLTRARAARTAAEAALQQARLNLARTRIRAPFDGRIRSKHVDVGQYVVPGAPLAVIYAVDYAEVRLPVPDDQVAFLDGVLEGLGRASSRLSIPVRLRTEISRREALWPGRVVRVEGEIDPRSHMVTLVARVEDPYGRKKADSVPPLAVGLFVTAEIQGRTAENVAVLPRADLREGSRVYVIDSDNRLRFRSVDILRADAGTAVIRSGLAPGERVCLSPMEAAVDGMAVRTTESSPDDKDSKAGKSP